MLDLVRIWLFDADDYRSALRRVGIAAIIVGVVDTAYFIAAIIHGQSYRTSLSIIAIIAGILLIQGNLKTCLAVARWIGFTGGALMSVIGGLALGTVWESFRNQHNLVIALGRIGYPTVAALAESIVFLTLILWAYRTLTSPAMLSAMREGGVDCDSFWRRPSTSILEGIALGVAALILATFLASTTVHH